MKCPLFYAHELDRDKEYPKDVNDCLKEECVLYDLLTRDCSFKTALLYLLSIAESLDTIRRHMPFKATL